MKIDNNINKTISTNVEIKRIMSGGVIWEKAYKWKKFKLRIIKEVIGTFDIYRSDSELLRTYPQYYKVETYTPEIGKYLVYGYRKTKGEYIEDVKSTNKKEYPTNGIKGNYWYELLK